MFSILVADANLMNSKLGFVTDNSKYTPNSIWIYGKYVEDVRVGDLLTEDKDISTVYEIVMFPMVRHKDYVVDNIDILIRPQNETFSSIDWKHLANSLIGKKLVKISK